MTNFYSMQFLFFLAIALICYYTVFRKKQWMCLLIVNAIFYCWTGLKNVSFLLLTGFTTWFGARWLAKYSKELVAIKKDKNIEKDMKESKKKKIMQKRRAIMWCVVFVNFGVLALLKYFKDMIGSQVLGLVLPLGISFYTFQSIGYLLDIYHDKYEPEQNFAKYMSFVSFFPQMIQGPINKHLVRQ